MKTHCRAKFSPSALCETGPNERTETKGPKAARPSSVTVRPTLGHHSRVGPVHHQRARRAGGDTAGQRAPASSGRSERVRRGRQPIDMVEFLLASSHADILYLPDGARGGPRMPRQHSTGRHGYMPNLDGTVRRCQ
uniref:Uncharacterized protein n=1 Tax=Setaria italica TaxID=4555 RepID=K3YAP6_SETIT